MKKIEPLIFFLYGCFLFFFGTVLFQQLQPVPDPNYQEETTLIAPNTLIASTSIVTFDDDATASIVWYEPTDKEFVATGTFATGTIIVGTTTQPSDLLTVKGDDNNPFLSVASSGLTYIAKDCFSDIPVTKQQCEDALSGIFSTVLTRNFTVGKEIGYISAKIEDIQQEIKNR